MGGDVQTSRTNNNNNIQLWTVQLDETVDISTLNCNSMHTLALIRDNTIPNSAHIAQVFMILDNKTKTALDIYVTTNNKST
jgi:hypothetical protein